MLETQLAQLAATTPAAELGKIPGQPKSTLESVNIMPMVTFKKLSYPLLSPTTMCVQLADSTVRYPEGVVENLMVKVKNMYILVDFVVLDMEGDLGIPLIIGRPFLKDTNDRIDVGTERISLRIMGKTMKFKFQNKREVFLIHEDSEK